MRVSKFIYLSAAVLSLSLTACGSKDTPVETTEAVIEEPVEDIGDAYVEDSYEAESEGDNGSSVRINLHNDNLEEEKVRVPVEYFKTLGRVIKQKEGYSIVLPEGEYLREATVDYQGHVFYFNEDGILTNDVLIKAYGKDGHTVIQKYIHNYSYQTGFIKINDKDYYVDAEEGLLTATTREIDGKTYYFDDNGKSISKSRYNSLYKNKNTPAFTETLPLESEIKEDEGVLEESPETETETLTETETETLTETETETLTETETETLTETKTVEATQESDNNKG